MVYPFLIHLLTDTALARPDEKIPKYNKSWYYYKKPYVRKTPLPIVPEHCPWDTETVRCLDWLSEEKGYKLPPAQRKRLKAGPIPVRTFGAPQHKLFQVAYVYD